YLCSKAPARLPEPLLENCRPGKIGLARLRHCLELRLKRGYGGIGFQCLWGLRSPKISDPAKSPACTRKRKTALVLPPRRCGLAPKGSAIQIRECPPRLLLGDYDRANFWPGPGSLPRWLAGPAPCLPHKQCV